MLFTSFEFVAFLACVLVLYYLIPVRFQWILLLVANVFFYAGSGLYGLLSGQSRSAKRTNSR